MTQPPGKKKRHAATGKVVPEKKVVADSKRLRPFIVTAPAFDHRSAGIRVVHTLCNELNRCGREAYMIFYKFRPGGGADFYTTEGSVGFSPEHDQIKRLPPTTNIEDFRNLIGEAYTIYPEVLQGNPLSAPRIARYILNNPAANGYPMHQGATDFIVSFHESYWKKPDHLLPILIDEPFFNDTGTLPPSQRTMDCTYIGKGFKFGDCFKIPGTVLIERSWPSDKEGLAVMLRNTRYFFTWDLVSQTNLDAVRCGAIPVVLRWAPYTARIFDFSYGQLPFGEVQVDGTNLKIDIDHAIFAEKRSRFLEGYKTVARSLTNDVDKFVAAVESHFMNENETGHLPTGKQP